MLTVPILITIAGYNWALFIFVDACLGNPCNSNGDCYGGNGGAFFCLCFDGWTGATCSIGEMWIYLKWIVCKLDLQYILILFNILGFDILIPSFFLHFCFRCFFYLFLFLWGWGGMGLNSPDKMINLISYAYAMLSNRGVSARPS